ncbi:MAG: hypothetical protein U5K51_08995 [Flavobacteriaceae bacterium]|nr:hypothetical protein [Flavobacteriaceae bacterium]
MYDHTNFEETKFGFTGFLNGSSSSYSQEVRKRIGIAPIARTFQGKQHQNPLPILTKYGQTNLS